MASGGGAAKSGSKQERAYAAIRTRILRGTYGPGYRLVIDALARELSMSQVPVREAIRRLEAEGWVTFERHVGARVAPANLARWESLMQVLAILEGGATALAAEHLTADDFQALRDLNQAMAAAAKTENPLAFSRLNREFHHRIISRCPNPVLIELAEDMSHRLDVVRRSIFLHIPARSQESVREHERLIELLERRAPASEIEDHARDNKLQTLLAFQERRGDIEEEMGVS